jgi:hypothetical protein
MASILAVLKMREAEKKKNKILILGSGCTAPLITEIDTSQWTVMAINNAYRLGYYDWLIAPTDFTNLPATDQLRDKRFITFFEYAKTNLPYGNQAIRGNTMMFNAAYYAIAQNPSMIGFLGCDMHYPTDGSNTHFYGTGTPDPLRLGEDNLMGFLNRLQGVADKNNIKLYNFSPDSQVSMLPYRRASILGAKKSLFISFNEPFVKYAEALIKSFWRYHKKGEWTVECFATNITSDLCQNKTFNNPSVIINNEHVEFVNAEEERCYMNSMRFVRYLDRLDKYDFVWMSDADALCLGNIDKLNMEMFGNDIAIIRDNKYDNGRKIRACSIGVRNTDGAKSFFNQYKDIITSKRKDNSTMWFNDQLAMLDILDKKNVKVHPIDAIQYCSFQNVPTTKMIMTATPNKFNNIHYKREYDLLMKP